MLHLICKVALISSSRFLAVKFSRRACDHDPRESRRELTPEKFGRGWVSLEEEVGLPP